MNRFRDDWINEESLKDWLVKVSNDDSRAYCQFCAIVLRAHKTDLITHSTCQKHLANAKIAIESGTATHPISVQIVINENDEQAESDGEEVDVKRPTQIKKERSSTSTPKRKSTNYRKKYRPEWEDDPELSEWLSPYPKDLSKALCKRCGVLLRAHKHDLSLHGRSLKHKSSVGLTSDEIEKLKAGPEDNSEDEMFDLDRSEPASKKTKPEINYDVLEADGNLDELGVFEANDSNDDKEVGEADSSRALAVRGSKKSMKDKCRYYPQRRRAKFTAADVVSAIENNEFTGYELLQIVKICVPKL